MSGFTAAFRRHATRPDRCSVTRPDWHCYIHHPSVPLYPVWKGWKCSQTIWHCIPIITPVFHGLPDGFPRFLGFGVCLCWLKGIKLGYDAFPGALFANPRASGASWSVLIQAYSLDWSVWVHSFTWFSQAARRSFRTCNSICVHEMPIGPPRLLYPSRCEVQALSNLVWYLVAYFYTGNAHPMQCLLVCRS